MSNVGEVHDSLWHDNERTVKMALTDKEIVEFLKGNVCIRLKDYVPVKFVNNVILIWKKEAEKWVEESGWKLRDLTFVDFLVTHDPSIPVKAGLPEKWVFSKEHESREEQFRYQLYKMDNELIDKLTEHEERLRKLEGK